MGIDTRVIDCSNKAANYYREECYIIPRIHIWLTYRNTCIGLMAEIGRKSYQAYIHLPKWISRFTERRYKEK